MGLQIDPVVHIYAIPNAIVCLVGDRIDTISVSGDADCVSKVLPLMNGAYSQQEILRQFPTNHQETILELFGYLRSRNLILDSEDIVPDDAHARWVRASVLAGTRFLQTSVNPIEETDVYFCSSSQERFDLGSLIEQFHHDATIVALCGDIEGALGWLRARETRKARKIIVFIADENITCEAFALSAEYAGVEWIWSRYDRNRRLAVIGALSTSLRSSAAYERLNTRQLDLSGQPPRVAAPSLCELDEKLFLNLLLHEVDLAIASQPSVFHQYFARHYDLNSWETSLHVWPAMLPSESAGSEADEDCITALSFEDVLLRRKQILTEGGQFPIWDHLKADRSLESEFKHSKRIVLFPLRRQSLSLEDRPSQEHTEASFTLEIVSEILALAAGYVSIGDDGKRHRALPTAGNRGSAEIFLLARNCPDLDPGLYTYSPEEHTLIDLSSHRHFDPNQILQQCLGSDKDQACPQILFFVVGNLNRLRDKYGEFSFKLIEFDGALCGERIISGITDHQLIAERVWPYPEESIERLLNLSQNHERVLAVIAGWSTHPGKAGRRWALKPVATRTPVHLDARSFAEYVYRESRTTENLLQRERQKTRMLMPDSDRGRWKRDRMAPLLSPYRRSTCRNFLPLSLEVADLVAVCSSLDSDLLSSSALTIVAIVNAVQGVPAGLYLGHGYRDSFEDFELLPDSGVIQENLSASLLGQAQLSFVVCANISKAYLDQQWVGYRRQHYLAGELLYAVWSRAEARELDSVWLAGIPPALQQVRFGESAENWSGLLSIAIGHRGDNVAGTSSCTREDIA